MTRKDSGLFARKQSRKSAYPGLLGLHFAGGFVTQIARLL